ncbi:DUF1767-domain-containing protein [Cubamyces sp. BRFM 1775]|nr:DUF1767-domain-containing protein [Cubamyces sp. BRFM 1775]
MIPPPAQIVQRLKRKYPRPSIDPDWLEGCYTWIREELHLTPENDMEEIMKHVEEQLLQSDFTDSMLAGTGFPPGITNADETILEGPILVEVTGIMEIGHSAYSLMQIYESRIEYRRQAQLRIANGDEDPGEQKPIPKYPRSMLQLELSDGASVLTAVEVKKLPELELGETPLGYKVDCLPESAVSMS